MKFERKLPFLETGKRKSLTFLPSRKAGIKCKGEIEKNVSQFVPMACIEVSENHEKKEI